MPHTCCVGNCKNRGALGEPKSFHRIPKHPHERRERWISSISRYKNTQKGPWIPKEGNRVCSEHFVTGRPSDDPSHPDYIPTLLMDAQNNRRKKKGKMEAAEETEANFTCLATEAFTELQHQASQSSSLERPGATIATGNRERETSTFSRKSISAEKLKKHKPFHPTKPVKDIGTQTVGCMSRVIHACVQESLDLKARLVKAETENDQLRRELQARILSVASTPGSVMKVFSIS